jgi:hypothetical protein
MAARPYISVFYCYNTILFSENLGHSKCRITFRLYMTFLQALETAGFQGLQKRGWSVAWEWSVAE